jgi:hypothetical protein
LKAHPALLEMPGVGRFDGVGRERNILVWCWPIDQFARARLSGEGW